MFFASKADVFFELYLQRQEVAIQRAMNSSWQRKKMHVCLNRAVNMPKALKQADRRKDEFLAMLAHELRNPLAPDSNSS